MKKLIWAFSLCIPCWFCGVVYADTPSDQTVEQQPTSETENNQPFCSSR